MPLTIRTFPAGPLDTNAYLVVDQTTNAAIIIDAPPGVTDEILAAAKELGVTIDQIIITHGHWDHIGDAATLARETGAPLLAHPHVAHRMERPPDSAPVPIEPATATGTLDEGDKVMVGETRFAVWFLPGHDPGHIVLLNEAERIFLGGDVLFPNGHGRTDIPGSDQAVMDTSLARLIPLPDDMMVYPGHGATTTIGTERSWLSAKS